MNTMRILILLLVRINATFIIWPFVVAAVVYLLSFLESKDEPSFTFGYGLSQRGVVQLGALVIASIGVLLLLCKIYELLFY